MTAALPLLALESTGFNAWHLVVALLTLAVPVIVAVAVLIALYWVIRRAVASGIRDAREHAEHLRTRRGADAVSRDQGPPRRPTVPRPGSASGTREARP